MAYTDHWTNLRRAETKRKKDSTLKPGKRRPQTQYVKKNNNNNEKAEKYFTNEGTN